MRDYLARWEPARLNLGSAEHDTDAVDHRFDPFEENPRPTLLEANDDPRAANLDPNLGAPAPAEKPIPDPPFEGVAHPWCGPEHLSDRWNDVHLDDRRFAIDLASHLLWAASGRQYGIVEREIRPCQTNPCSCGWCVGALVRLPGPIAQIKWIVENGEYWDPNRYRRYGRRHVELVTRPGERTCWPCGNDDYRSPYMLPVQSCPPEEACPDLPDWARSHLARYGLELTGPANADDVCVGLLEKFPDVGQLVDPGKCPDWARSWLADRGLSIVWGSCAKCRDANGDTYSADGRRYVCGGTSTITGTPTLISTGCCSGPGQTTNCACSAHVVSTSTCAEPELPLETIVIKPDTPDWQIQRLLTLPNRNIQLVYGDDPGAAYAERHGDPLTKVHFAAGPNIQGMTIAPAPMSDKQRQVRADLADRDANWHSAWAIRCLQGRVVPNYVARLAGMVADETLKIMHGEPGCLPTDYMTRLNRAGIIATYQSNNSLDKKLSRDEAAMDPNSRSVFGIELVDKWLASINPHKLPRKSKVIRADDWMARGVRSV